MSEKPSHIYHKKSGSVLPNLSEKDLLAIKKSKNWFQITRYKISHEDYCIIKNTYKP